jgi:hypothetical protein
MQLPGREYFRAGVGALKDRGGPVGQTGTWELQAVGDVLNGGVPSEIGGVWQRGVVLNQGQLSLDSEHFPGGLKAMGSQVFGHIRVRSSAPLGATTDPEAERWPRAGLRRSGKESIRRSRLDRDITV